MKKYDNIFINTIFLLIANFLADSLHFCAIYSHIFLVSIFHEALANVFVLIRGLFADGGAKEKIHEWVYKLRNFLMFNISQEVQEKIRTVQLLCA